MRFTVTDRFEIPAANAGRTCDAALRYWEVYFDKRFQRALYEQGLGCTLPDGVEQTGDLQTCISRRIRFLQPLDAPGPLKALFGETTEMCEQGRFDLAEGVFRFEMIPGRLSDRIRVCGETRLSGAPGGVERTCEMEVRVRMPGLGGLVERFIVSTIRASYAAQTRFTRAFIDSDTGEEAGVPCEV